MKRSTLLACAGLTVLALAATPAATAGPVSTAERAVGGFEGPRGFDIGASGKTVIAEADGTVTRVFRSGARKGDQKRIAKVPASFIAPAVAVGPDNAVWILTAGGDEPTTGLGTLFLKEPGKKIVAVRNIQRWAANNDAGLDPFDLEESPHESNPYGVAALPGGGAVVADAANNSVLRVSRKGAVKVLARVKPRVVSVPEEMQGGEQPLPSEMPAEAVVTSVAVGPDGSIYFGELRGFPGGPGTSSVWRVERGSAKTAVCKPARPEDGRCTMVADGFTSVVGLDTGRGGSIYVAELTKAGWLAMESGDPAAFVGSVIRVGHDRTVRRELSAGEVMLPGAVAVGPAGNVFVSGPVFGPGGFMKVS